MEIFFDFIEIPNYLGQAYIRSNTRNKEHPIQYILLVQYKCVHSVFCGFFPIKLKKRQRVLAIKVHCKLVERSKNQKKRVERSKNQKKSVERSKNHFIWFYCYMQSFWTYVVHFLARTECGHS